VIKSKSIWAGHVVCKKKWKYMQEFGGKLEGKNNLEDLGVHGKITLPSMLKK
jgi:hypothetical protein